MFFTHPFPLFLQVQAAGGCLYSGFRVGSGCRVHLGDLKRLGLGSNHP